MQSCSLEKLKMSTSTSPCAACKFLRRKCTQECVFAPYFPPEQPYKFANVHKVFGASNVAKILMEISPDERADAVTSLAYEAEARLKDPIYGCVGTISILQNRLKNIHGHLYTLKQELATYVGPSAMMPIRDPQPHPGFGQVYSNVQPHVPVRPANVQPTLSLQGSVASPDGQHQRRLYGAHEKQQLDENARELELLRNFQQQQNHQQPSPQQSGDLLRFNSGFDAAGPSRQGDPGDFNQLRGPAVSPSLALTGSYDDDDDMHHHHQQHQLQFHHHRQQHQQLMPPLQLQQQPHHGGQT